MSQYTKESMIKEQGHKKLTGKELHKKIINKTTWGNYLMGYRFMIFLDNEGNAEGINNVGSHNKGEWFIDMNNNTLYGKWDYSWAETTTNAYDVNGVIHFFDCDTGNWRMAITHIKNDRIPIAVDNIV